jgi:hypothetical protein
MRIILQKRDISIFRELAASRFLTVPQISNLCFNGKVEATKKRLQKLKNCAYLESERILWGCPPCVWLRPKAATFIDHRLKRRPATSPAIATLQHEIAVRDFRTAILVQQKNSNSTLEECSIAPSALSFGSESWLRPDAFLSLGTPAPQHFFVEIDRGTESLCELMEKAEEYRRLLKAGVFARRCGSATTEYKKHPFRVLLLLSSERRQENLLTALSTQGFREFVLTTSVDRACKTPFGCIWRAPAGGTALRLL